MVCSYLLWFMLYALLVFESIFSPELYYSVLCLMIVHCRNFCLLLFSPPPPHFCNGSSSMCWSLWVLDCLFFSLSLSSFSILIFALLVICVFAVCIVIYVDKMSEKYRDKNKHTCTHTCMLTHTCTCAHTQAHTHACTHIHTYIQAHMCMHTHTDTHTHLHKLVVVTLVKGINLRWAWESVLKRLCYTYMYVVHVNFAKRDKKNNNKKHSMMQRSVSEWVYTLTWKDACYLNKSPTMMCLAKKKKKIVQHSTNKLTQLNVCINLKTII